MLLLAMLFTQCRDDVPTLNPDGSMKAAIANAKQVSKEKNLIFILADMFELGEYASEEHQDIAHYAESLSPNAVYLIGNDFMNTHTSFAQKFSTTENAIAHLKKEHIRDSVILIKGSNGMNLSELYNDLDF